MKPSMNEVLRTGLESLGVPAEERLCQGLLHFSEELRRWNRRINLTAVTEPHEILTHHIFDSLSVLPYLSAGSLLDVGSGAGLPGLLLALAVPDLMVTSIESRNKKIAFQRHMARELGLNNFSAVCARVEQWKAPEPYAQIISRAFSSIPLFLELAGLHLARDGQILAMKGRLPEDELAKMPKAWQLVKMQPLSVPGLAAERHLLVLSQASSD